jgi:hypothetical protein
MVRVVEQDQRRARAKPRNQWAQKVQVREVIPGSLEEQEWRRRRHVEEMRAALVRWFARCVQREAQEYQAPHAR